MPPPLAPTSVTSAARIAPFANTSTKVGSSAPKRAGASAEVENAVTTALKSPMKDHLNGWMTHSASVQDFAYGTLLA
jgi:hypothetical protein